MSDMRMVAMSAEQYEEVNRHIEMLMRGNLNERASTMMTLALAYKFAKPEEPELPTNVVDLHDFSKRVGA